MFMDLYVYVYFDHVVKYLYDVSLVWELEIKIALIKIICLGREVCRCSSHGVIHAHVRLRVRVVHTTRTSRRWQVGV
jgi:hypothetical protein